MSRLRTSVVIPTHNRIVSLRRTLGSLRAQSTPPNEVIVVDDFSTDETRNVCLSYAKENLPFEFRILRMVRNMGPAAARNLGVANAKNDLILFTDDDCEPDQNWVKELLTAMREHPNLAGVGGPVLSADGARFGMFYDFHSLLDPKLSGPDNQAVYLVTANAAYQRDRLLAVGGFSEDLKKPGGEDPGLSFKIAADGGTMAFVPSAIVFHHYAPSLRSVLRTFWNYGYGGCYVARAFKS